MSVIKVNEELCSGCESCIEVCPHDAIEMKDGKAFINEYCQICSACMEVCPEGAISDTRGAGGSAEGELAAYKGVWIYAEQREGKVSSVARELLGAGRRLADDLGVELAAVLIGAPESEAKELIEYGADKVYVIDDEGLRDFNDEPYAEIISKLIEQYKPEVILAGATAIGRSFIPRIAARMHVGLTADCTELEVDKETRNLNQTRPAFGGNIMATILTPNHRPQVATVRPRVMKAIEPDAKRTGEVIAVKADYKKPRTRVIETVKEESASAVNLQEAQIIVSGGRGCGGADAFKLLGELAEALEGTVGASRGAVDEGWIPYRHQVGQTGKTVCPKIYIACGISGAVQHLVGMQSSDMIIAINKNAEAPIFNVATYGLVGDLKEIVPMLVKKIKQAKGI